jgi:hypothetical protein
MMNWLLDDALTGEPGEHRDEAMHVRIEREPASHVASHRLQPAVVVVEPQPRQPAHQAVEHPRRHRLVPRVEPRRLPAVHEPHPGLAAEPCKQPRDLRRIVLAVAVEHHHMATPRPAEARHQSGRFAEPAVVPDQDDPRVGGRRDRDVVARAVGGAVVDHEQFPGEAGRIEHAANLGDERADVAGLVAGGHHERDVGRGHRGLVRVGRRGGSWRIP